LFKNFSTNKHETARKKDEAPSVKTKNVIICYMVRAISQSGGRDK
jgi:hypothetical protein